MRVVARQLRALALVLCASVVASVVAPSGAGAHLGNLSYADFEVRGNQVLLRFKYAAHVTPGVPPQQTAPTTRAQVLALQGAIEAWLGDTTRVESGGKACRLAVDNLIGPDRNDDLEVIALWSCVVPEIAGLRIDLHPLSSVMDDWQTIVSLRMGGKSFSTVLTETATRWQVGEAAAADAASSPATTAVPGSAGAAEVTPADGGSTFSSFFALGVHHIWTGYDHLVFLLAVLLAGGSILHLAGIVTSFTVAHSITLGTAATGLVQLPIEPVEALIALSIVYVAIEDLLDRGSDRRALVTFVFGLIHGFGFASVLAETALPAGSILVPLLAFNLGVEAGQLAVVILVVPILAVVLRSRHGLRIKQTLSVLIALAGTAWAVERIAAF